MGIAEKIMLCIFVVAVLVFSIFAGIAILWTTIEDTALGRAIDEMMAKRIERWKRKGE